MSGAQMQAAEPMQVLTLALNGEVFALEARYVHEILDVVPVTQVPGADACLNGLINVRGKVLPLLALSRILGLPCAETNIDSRFIVVQVEIEGVAVAAGLRADKVYEMTELATGDLCEAPQIGLRIRPDFVQCVGKRGDAFLVVLKLEAIFATLVPGDPPSPGLRLAA